VQRHARHAHPVKALLRAPELLLLALLATATAFRLATSRQVVHAVRNPSALAIRVSVTDIAWVPSSCHCEHGRCFGTGSSRASRCVLRRPQGH